MLELTQAESARVVTAVDRVVGRVANFERAFQSFREGVDPDLAKLGVSFDALVQLTINKDPLLAIRTEAARARSKAIDRLDASKSDSLPAELKATEEEISKLQAKLDEPSRKYQAYLQEVEEWTRKQEEINGDIETPGSLFFLKAQLDEIATVPDVLDGLYAGRKAKTREIYGEILTSRPNTANCTEA